MTGDAFTFVSPEETTDLAAIERAIGKRLPRITVPGFDYTQAPAERFEVPIAERIAAIRARKAEERKRAKEKVERRLAHESAQRARGPQRPRGPGRGSRGPAGGRRPQAAPARGRRRQPGGRGPLGASGALGSLGSRDPSSSRSRRRHLPAAP